MDALVSKLQKKKSQLSNLENQVLEYILANPKESTRMTIDELADKLFISTATISRTAKRLGFKGFQELKYVIVQYTEQERRQTDPKVLANENATFRDSLVQQMNVSFEQVENKNIKETLDLLKKANTIEIIGVGGSYPNCLDAARKLMALGKKATARMDWDELRDVSKVLSSEDLAVLISLSGETIHIIEYATNFVERDVPIIAIVGTEGSTLEKLATYTFRTLVEPIYFGEVDLSSRVALSGILDLLIIRFANELDKN
jgi:DNA-binding MurR/RpiR family transcriptional regulator